MPTTPLLLVLLVTVIPFALARATDAGNTGTSLSSRITRIGLVEWMAALAMRLRRHRFACALATCCGSDIQTRATLSHATRMVLGRWRSSRILWREFVSPYALGCDSILGCWPNAAKDIRSASHWFKVARIKAMAPSAEMIKLSPDRYRPDKQFICEAMGFAGMPLPLHLRIAIAKKPARPQPTFIGSAHVRGETLAEIHRMHAVQYNASGLTAHAWRWG